MVKMKYALYKNGYSEFKAHDYDKDTKTIMVDLPERTKEKFPKEWEKVGNRYCLPNGTIIYFWGSGYYENFRVERYINHYNIHSEDISAGINARSEAIKTALYFDSLSETE